MRIIKVDATDSTNTLVREMYRENSALEPLCLRALDQTSGRGQKGNTWVSEPCTNLTFSLFLKNLTVPVQEQFKLSMLVSLAVFEVLEKNDIPKIAIKWPNDILSANLKVGGILIENFLKGNKIHATIIGIGLNVNQEKYEDLPRAASLKMVTGRSFNLEELLQQCCHQISEKVLTESHRSITSVLEEYHRYLFAKDEIYTFELPNQKRFPGIIQGVDAQGNLVVKTENEAFQKYEVKQVRLLY